MEGKREDSLSSLFFDCLETRKIKYEKVIDKNIT